MQEELTYEQAMQKLEALTQQMERGEIGIEEERLYESEKNCKSLLQMDENV